MDFFQDINQTLSDPTIFFIPVFVTTILVEMYLSIKLNKKDNYEKKDTRADLLMGIGSLVIKGTFTKTLEFILFTYLYTHYALFDFNVDQWYAWVILIFAEDFTFYVYHRSGHEIRFMWAGHVNHHSSEKYNFAVALRQPWTNQLFAFTFFAWLAVLGFPAAMIVTMGAISLVYQFFVHTNLVGNLGFIEKFMNTPSHHRIHHAVNVPYLDRNHGGIFIIWDKLFGTYADEVEKPMYGLTNNIKTYNIIKIAFHEYISLWKDMKRAPNFNTSLKYLYMPPGWSHDGTTKTANELRAEKDLTLKKLK